MIEINNSDVLDDIKTYPDYFFNIEFADPPYNLGSEIIVDKTDGKLKFKGKAQDFMNKWQFGHEQWETFMAESFRVLKYGGFCLLFGMDRQLSLIQYYALKAGFEIQQSLYWYFISSFPKATDASKMIDKRLGLEREIEKENPNNRPNKMIDGKRVTPNQYITYNYDPITKPNSPLAQKYNGYKYSIAPLKQTLETIMVFRKPVKTSVIDDIMTEDEECSPAVLNIDGGRVETKQDLGRLNKDAFGFCGQGTVGLGANNFYNVPIEKQGRYPSQLFIDEQAGNVIDGQSGESFSSGGMNPVRKNNVMQETKGMYTPKRNFNTSQNIGGLNDFGGASRILHKCKYELEEIDLIKYSPKVSNKERNLGLDGYELIIYIDTLWKINNTELQEKRVRLLVDMEQYRLKAIGECGINQKDDKDLNMFLFGKSIMEQFLKDYKCTISTEINLITGSRILNLLQQFIINESIRGVSYEKMDGGNLVINVTDCYMNQIITEAKKDGFSPNVSNVGLKGQLNISVDVEKKSSGHPTLKPMKLIKHVLTLFKLSIPQNIYIPFSGAGSEIIGAQKAGFDNIYACELSQEYIDIATARIDFWKQHDLEKEITESEEIEGQGELFT